MERELPGRERLVVGQAGMDKDRSHRAEGDGMLLEVASPGRRHLELASRGWRQLEGLVG